MKKIKVYLQYPWKPSDSQYYKSMIDNPPEGIEYVGGGENVGMISNNSFFLLSNFLKRQVRFWTNKFGFVIPNVHLSPKGDYDLIHCAHCLSKNKDKPWVLDVESLWQLWVSGKGKDGSREKVLEYLMRDNCKKIIAWTKETKKDIIRAFPEIKDKVEVVYYAMKMPELRQTKKLNEIVLFFSGRHFYAKGGLHATEVIDRLTKKYDNVRGVINGVIPSEVRKRYSGNGKLKFHGLMPHREVLKLYRDADIFVYSGYSDSFGFVFMEAMAFGIPVVTVDGYARREVIKDGVTGFVLEKPKKIRIREIDERIVEKMVKKVEILIKDKGLRNKMSRVGIREVKNGKFSIIERNGKLRRIYEEVLV